MIKNKQKGYVLASVITLSAMVFVIGSSSLYMASLGSQTVTSEIQYNKASHAVELALNNAVKAVIDLAPNYATSTYELKYPNITWSNSDSSWVKLNDSGAQYRYKTVPDSQKNNCFVYAEAKFSSGARVVKTTIIPIKPPVVVNNGQSPAVGGKSVSNFNASGSSKSVGNDCGGPGVTVQTAPNTQTTNNLNSNTGAEGQPDLKVDPNMPSVYSTTFGTGITNRATLDAYIDANVATKLADSSIPDACKIDPPANQVQNTNCTTNKYPGNKIKIDCTGGVNKTVDPNTCSKIVIKAGSLNVLNSHEITNQNMTVSVSNNLSINAGVSGLWTSKNVLNINDAGNQIYNGVFIGADSNNFNLTGTTKFNGLFFIGNSSGNSNLNINMGGTSNVRGSIQVDGNINNFARNGNGNTNYAPYDITYDHQKINDWRDDYPGLLQEFTCGGAANTSSPSVATSISRTKMTMF